MMDSLVKQKTAQLVRAEALYLNAANEHNKACEIFNHSGHTRNFVEVMKTGYYFISVKEEISRCEKELKKAKAELKVALYNLENYNMTHDVPLWLTYDRFIVRALLLLLGFAGFIVLCTKIGW